jgi:hypothetical protein
MPSSLRKASFTNDAWSLACGPLAGRHDLAQFRADTDAEYVDRFFIPGIRKAGDLRAAAVMNASGKVLVW